MLILINNQLVSAAYAKGINTEYYITNNALASRYHGSVSVVVGKETRNKISGFEPGKGRMFLMNFFVYQLKCVRSINWDMLVGKFLFLIKLTGSANAS